MEKQRSVYRCFEVTKKYTSGSVGTFQRSKKSLISAKHCGLRQSIRAWETITRNPAERERERERGRIIGSVVIIRHLASHTTWIARHRSFIKLKFIRNVCSSCGTLTEQVTCNPRFYCISRWWWFARRKEMHAYACLLCVRHVGFLAVISWNPHYISSG